jgi:signal transduction histidine kinase
MSNYESELSKQLPIEQLALLYKQSFAAFVATITVLLYIIYNVHELINIRLLVLWAGAVITFNLYLLIWLYLVHRATQNAVIDSRKAKRFIIAYQIQALLHGLSWGVLPFLLIELNSAEMKFFAYIILCGMAAGAIGTTAMVYRIYLSFMLPMMLPGIFTQLFLRHDEALFSRNTFEMLIIFIISLVVLGHAHYKSILRSVTLMVENKHLLGEVTDALEKVEAASKAKSSFLANMSHELRTPLNAVIGYSEMISDHAMEKDYAPIPKDAEKISQAGQHLLSLINNVLDLSKVESGKMEVFIEEINISQLLAEIKSSTQPLMQKNNNNMSLHIAETPIIITSDITKLRQILLNIISNAAKFTDKGQIEVNTTTSAHTLKISISDTGIGMTESQLVDLTTPFMQADVSTTKKYGGTGLGMSLTEHLTRLLCIDMSVKSSPNAGTIFTLSIPLAFEVMDSSI